MNEPAHTHTHTHEPLLRVFVIDDHCLIRYGFDAAFNAETHGISLAGYACSVPEALKNPSINEAEVIILDYYLGAGSDPVSNIQSVRKALPLIPVVILSHESDIPNQLIMFREGAKAFLNKSQERDDIVHTLHLVCSGAMIVSDDVKSAALNAERGAYNKLFLDTDERKIVLELSDGHRAKEIGQHMHLTSSAINKKVHRLCSRFGATTPIQLLLMLARKKEI